MRITFPAILTTVRWLLVLLLAYSAAFLREDEEGTVQNRLEEWWIRLMYSRDRSISKAAAFMRGIARLSNRAFDAILGERLWSFQAVGVSFWFSLASFFLTDLIASYVPHFMRRPLPHHVWFLYFASTAILGLLPSIVGRRLAFAIWVLTGMIYAALELLPFVMYAVHGVGYATVLHTISIVLLILALSFVFDVLYVITTRWMLRRVTTMQRAYEIIVVIVLDCVLALALVEGPSVISSTSRVLLKTEAHIELVVLFNLVDILACSVFLLLMLLMLVHRLLWPMLERPIYSLQRHGIIRNKKLLWALAGALAFGPKGIDFAKYVVEKVL